ncbi:hypothetical protein BDQ94DRAFT_170150 [Aspergillus welwitschiae]|uniref:Uncharacterized protein n=1 Tax=Aspergillus welwitschiae TaxID=1341132 RepID=A0A3F3Q2V5_9EURO|nr:hypothetical protein BDQ94DRAFT_170150 [Aspergillus welwitschiae]RDH33529.1 hypothetical protein BDQ94DRAFT_170150 [Aspergillus welwitschiae]
MVDQVQNLNTTIVHAAVRPSMAGWWLQLPHSVRFLQACLMYIDPTLCLCVSLMHMSHDLHGYVSLYDLYDLEYLQLRYPLCVMNLDNL